MHIVTNRLANFFHFGFFKDTRGDDLLYLAIRISTEANQYSYLILLIKYKFNIHVHKTDILKKERTCHSYNDNYVTQVYEERFPNVMYIVHK